MFKKFLFHQVNVNCYVKYSQSVCHRCLLLYMPTLSTRELLLYFML